MPCGQTLCLDCEIGTLPVRGPGKGGVWLAHLSADTLRCESQDGIVYVIDNLIDIMRTDDGVMLHAVLDSTLLGPSGVPRFLHGHEIAVARLWLLLSACSFQVKIQESQRVSALRAAAARVSQTSHPRRTKWQTMASACAPSHRRRQLHQRECDNANLTSQAAVAERVSKRPRRRETRTSQTSIDISLSLWGQVCR